MFVKTIDHIAVNVKNLKKSFAFYEEVMGLKRSDFTMDLGFCTVYFMGLPGGVQLELINYSTDERTLETADTDLGIYRHIAFTVDSLDEVRERCRRFGVRINLERTYNEFFDYYVMLVEDPNGVEIEFIEKTAKGEENKV